MERKIFWDEKAITAFKDAISFIRKDSFQNAASVKADILSKVKELRSSPDIHPPDKYKIGNDGHFRAFEIHRFRISYWVMEQVVLIVRFRHTSQKPEPY